jgi:hypothetical protein
MAEVDEGHSGDSFETRGLEACGVKEWRRLNLGEKEGRPRTLAWSLPDATSSTAQRLRLQSL